MNVRAIVPVKSPDKGKGRLASVLAADERRCLVLAMLNDVLAQLGQAQGIDGVALVASDPAFRRHDVQCIDDPGRGLNAAIAHAVSLVQSEGATAIVMIAADTPFTTTEEIENIVATGRTAQVVLVPNRSETGTNALMLSPPDLMSPAFGVGSFSRHMAQAASLGVTPRVLRLPGLGFDIDSPADLDTLRGRVAHRKAYGFLRPVAGATG